MQTNRQGEGEGEGKLLSGAAEQSIQALLLLVVNPTKERWEDVGAATQQEAAIRKNLGAPVYTQAQLEMTDVERRKKGL